jgi:septal ring factor EnvC (AmiA/AmiB activator)
MKLLVWLALSATARPALEPIEDQRTVTITLEKLQTLRDRLGQDHATDRDLGEQETRMVATLEDLEYALSEAKRAARLSRERLKGSREHLVELEEQRSALERVAVEAKSEARLALGLLLRGNHAGANKPLLRAFERQRVGRASSLWRRAVHSSERLSEKVAEVARIEATQRRLKNDLERLFSERSEVRRLAEKRLAEVRRDRKRARAHGNALEQQRLALAAWLEQVKPVRGAAHLGLRRGHLLPPVAGKLINGYGWQEAKDKLTRWRNRGIDLEGLSTAPVVASASGRVAFVGRSPGLGLALVLDHGGGWRTIYGGLSETKAVVGDDLKPGVVLGFLGDSGILHFELRSEALAVNPTNWFNKTVRQWRR